MGPQNEQRGPEVLYYQHNTLIQQVVNLDCDAELRNLVQGNDASTEEIVQEIIQIKQTMGHMSQVLTEAFAGVRGDAQNQNRELQSHATAKRGVHVWKGPHLKNTLFLDLEERRRSNCRISLNI